MLVTIMIFVILNWFMLTCIYGSVQKLIEVGKLQCEATIKLVRSQEQLREFPHGCD